MDQQDQIRQDQAHLEAVVAEALEIAKGLGAGLAEVSISKQTGLSVNTRGCELESIEFNKDGALGIAVYRNTSIKGRIDALEANYPTVSRLVGTEWFRAAAREFVEAEPGEASHRAGINLDDGLGQSGIAQDDHNHAAARRREVEQ